MPEFAAPLRPPAKPLDFPRGTLITPSASPPSSRPASPAVRRKSTSRPPPLKRVRTESTHGTATPPTASTSSEPDSTVDNNRDEAWKLSSQRLLDKWAQLAERYNVPLDQDDIIDFRGDKLVKDRGVTRRTKKSLLFGDLLSEVDASSEDGAADENDDENDNGNDGGPVPREQEAPVKVKLEMEKTNRVLSPFTEMNPADADDLKAFLAEEERRRRTGGVDDLEDDDDNSDWVTEYDPEDGSRRRRITVMVGTFDRPPSPEDDSEDEFARWEADDATPRPAAPRTPSRPSSDDIIDLTTPSPPSSPDPPVVRSRTPAKSPMRSVRTYSAEDVVPEAGPSSRKPPGLPRVPARNTQLYTPPLSAQSSSEIGTPSDSHGERESLFTGAVSRVSDRIASPRASRNTPGSAGVRRATKPKQSSLSKASLRDDAEETPKSQPRPQRKSTTPATRRRLMAEVVVPRRPKPNKKLPAQPVSPERSLSSVGPGSSMFVSGNLPGETSPRTPPRRKGKEVARVVESTLESSDDEPLPPPKPRAKSRPPEIQALASLSPPPQRGHKRKRSLTPPISSPIRRMRTPSPPRKSVSRAKSLPPSSAKPRQSALKRKGREKPVSDDEIGDSPEHPSSTRSRTTRSHALGSKEQLPSHLTYATPPFPPLVPPEQHQPNAFQTAVVHYLSYLFANAPGYVPPLPLPYSPVAMSATPQTPKRRMRAPRREASTSPGSTGPSSSPRPTSPLTREELYKHHLDSMYSSVTPPPASSSPAPSPPSSPAPRTPGGRVRSKSRGRRVSFKLDPEDRPLFQKGQRAKKAVADAESRFADDQSSRSGKERRAVRGMGSHSDDDDLPMPKPRGERGRTPGPSRSESVNRRR